MFGRKLFQNWNIIALQSMQSEMNVESTSALQYYSTAISIGKLYPQAAQSLNVDTCFHMRVPVAAIWNI